jgi:hypothetical protein
MAGDNQKYTAEEKARHAARVKEREARKKERQKQKKALLGMEAGPENSYAVVPALLAIGLGRTAFGIVIEALTHHDCCSTALAFILWGEGWQFNAATLRGLLAIFIGNATIINCIVASRLLPPRAGVARIVLCAIAIRTNHPFVTFRILAIAIVDSCAPTILCGASIFNNCRLLCNIRLSVRSVSLPRL